MIRNGTIWIHIAPEYWWTSDRQPRGVKFGKVRRTAPPRDDQANWVKVEFAVDDARFAVAVDAMVTE